MCLEIGTVANGLNVRDQLIFYGNFGEGKIDQVLLGQKDGNQLSQYNQWCIHTSTDGTILNLNSQDSGITLKSDVNIIDLATSSAKVEFTRPLLVSTTDTVDLDATESGVDFNVYLSYSYT